MEQQGQPQCSQSVAAAVAVQAIIHLRKRQQANRVKHEKRIKMVLFDYVAPLEQSLPLVAKKFNYDNWQEFNLYVSGEKERTRARHTHAAHSARTPAHAPSHSKSVVAGADWPITQLPPAALKLDQSLLSQGILPDTVFALRKPDEPVDQVMHPIKQRITISLNQQNQGTTPTRHTHGTHTALTRHSHGTHTTHDTHQPTHARAHFSFLACMARR
jgi:hypothetical protein